MSFHQQTIREIRRTALPQNQQRRIALTQRQTRVLGMAVVANASAQAILNRELNEAWWAFAYPNH